MLLTDSKKELLKVLEGLEIINKSDSYSYFKYKLWGVGKFFGWMEHRDARIAEGPIISNRLFGRFHAVDLSLYDSIPVGSDKFEGEAKYIASLSNGLVTKYLVGQVFNVWELFGEEKIHITTESTHEEKDACELRTLKRLLAFIDKLESEK